jgi:hypothetical protein
MAGLFLPTTAEGLVTRLALARAARGLSCGELGAALEISAAQVSAWERGLGEPSAGQWAALALRLGWSRRDLEGVPLPERVAFALAVRARNRMVVGLRRSS